MTSDERRIALYRRINGATGPLAPYVTETAAP